MITLKKINELCQLYDRKEVLIADDETMTWNQYQSRVENGIVWMLKQNMISGDNTRALIISENTWKVFVLFSCLTTCKIPYSGIDYSMDDDKKMKVIKNSGAKIVFYSKKHMPVSKITEKLPQVKFVDIDDIEFHKKLKLENFYQHHFNKQEISGFSFSSGTTGVPKCIYRKKAFDNIRLPQLTDLYGFDANDNFLVTMPFYHVSVIGWVKLTLVNGGRVILSDFTSAMDMVEKIHKYAITTTLMTPPVLKKVVDRAELDQALSKSLRFIMVGGKNFPTILKARAIKLFGPILNEYYGSSETGINTLADSYDMLKYPESSGKCMDGSFVVILDKNMKPVKGNEIGRIAINSYQNAAGYLDSDMSKVMVDGKEYIITADKGYINDEGYIFVVQRIIFGGQTTLNVFDLENKLRMIKYVDDLVILQEPNQKLNITLAVQELSNLQLKLVDDMVKSLLNQYNLDFSTTYVSDIEYSMSGKVKYFNYKEENHG